jgi:hypothetical protein
MSKQEKQFTSSAFRAELKKYQPGFKWTVHKPRITNFFEATGVQSAGLNRTGTMSVSRNEKSPYSFMRYEVKVAGFGTRSNWLETNTGKTLSRALRNVQDDCSKHARNYEAAANMIQAARKKEAE